MIAGGCETDGNYAASVSALANEVRASLSVAVDGDLELLLERHVVGEAFGWEHCPVLHAEASVNGLPMEAVREGGWVPLSGGRGLLDGGGGGFCESMLYRLLDPPASLLEEEGVRVELRDEGGVIALEVPFIGIPSLALDPPVLVPGQRGEIAVLPAADALDLEGVSRVRYLGGFARKAPGHSTVGFSIDEIEASANGLSFVVPEGLEDSHGKLSLERLRGVHPHDWPEHGWWLSVTSCEGAAGCKARRKIDGELALDLSVSASGEPVTPDPLEDYARWRSCWFDGETQGGAELLWSGDTGCSPAFSPDGELTSVSYFDAPVDAPAASFELAFGDLAVEAEARTSVEVTVSTKQRAWRHSACTVRIDQVWRDIPERYPVVVDGSGECPGSAVPLGLEPEELTIGSFVFRAPVVAITDP